MKALAILLLFIGMVLVIKGYYSNKYKELEEPKVIIKYIPRSEYDEQLSPQEKLDDFYKGLFEKTQPNIYDNKINIDTNNKEK
jgi:hypothetical protein